MELPGFCGPSYRSQSPIADAERLVNWYVERLDPGQPATTGGFGQPLRYVLYPTHGLRAKAVVGASPGRALFGESGRVFLVVGNQLYEYTVDGLTTARGAVLDDGHLASIVSNGDGGGELCVAAGGQVGILDLTTLVWTPNVGGLTNIRMVGMVGGFLVAFDPTTSQFRISKQFDGLTWPGLDEAQRTIAPDPWVSMLTTPEGIWLFGEETSEVWELVGGAFPFALNTSSLMPQGIAAAWSAARLEDGSIMWLAQSNAGGRAVVRAEGFTPRVVSDKAMAYALGRYGRVDDAEGFGYQDQGHLCYELSIPSQNVTWVYDVTEGSWFEKGSWNGNLNRYDAWRARQHVHQFNQHLVLDRTTGTIAEMTIDVATDLDAMIRRERTSPGLRRERDWLFYTSFEVDLEPGLGLAVGQGSDPLIMMQMSRNGGKTFGTERMRSAGKMGEYGKRQVWNACGRARDAVFKVSVTDPIPWRLLGAFVNVAA